MRVVSIAAVLSMTPDALAQSAPAAGGNCVPVGQWVRPATGAGVAYQAIINDLATGAGALLGETHDDPDHHRWQLQTIAALYALRNDLVLGFESFPRRVQSALDRWVAGELSETEFLRQTDWRKVWGFEPALYMPLFHFARMNRIPMVALNVGQDLVSLVSKNGWDGVSEAERRGITTPAPPSADYLDRLAVVYKEHPRFKPAAGKVAEAFSPDDPAFQRFVGVQLLWDRAMAQAISDAKARPGDPFVIGIAGTGHLQNRQGIPHQLDDLGIADVAVLLPWTEGQACDALTDGLADAVLGLAAATDREAKEDKPRLGVTIRTGTGGVQVDEVMAKSVAAAAMLEKDDIIVEAAGIAVAKTAELIEIIGRQAPGTWLPLKVRRGDKALELVAKFPPKT